MAAVPSIGRATRVERGSAPGADAAGDLYERYSGQIFGYCFHQLGSREEAEDAVQTTFMNAFRGLARGIVPDAESAWLFKIAHNVCLSRRRSSWRRGRVEAPNNFEVLQEVVPARERIGDELIRLQDVLETMPENQRRAILLREWQGFSYREIADELDVSQAAVETLIFRARRALAHGLEEDASSSSWRKRMRRGADVGALGAFLKALLGGGAAAVAVGTAVFSSGGPQPHPTFAPLPKPKAPQHVAATTASASTRRGVVVVPTVRPTHVAVHRATHTAQVAKHVRKPSAANTAPVHSAPVQEAPAVVAAPPAPAAQVERQAPAQVRTPATHGKAKGHEKQETRAAQGPSQQQSPAAVSPPGQSDAVPPGQQDKDKTDHGNGNAGGNGNGKGPNK